MFGLLRGFGRYLGGGFCAAVVLYVIASYYYPGASPFYFLIQFLSNMLESGLAFIVSVGLFCAIMPPLLKRAKTGRLSARVAYTSAAIVPVFIATALFANIVMMEFCSDHFTGNEIMSTFSRHQHECDNKKMFEEIGEIFPPDGFADSINPNLEAAEATLLIGPENSYLPYNTRFTGLAGEGTRRYVGLMYFLPALGLLQLAVDRLDIWFALVFSLPLFAVFLVHRQVKGNVVPVA